MKVQIREETQREIIQHCNTVWPLISQKPADLAAIAEANRYLDALEAADYAVYDVVMQMLGKAAGLDWRAISAGQ